MKGYVYVLTNEAMPGLVKIGRSKHAAGVRAKQIYKGDTGVPLPFDVHFECLFDDCIEAEALVHEYLDEHRVNPCREFFRMEAEEAAIWVLRVRAEWADHQVWYAEECIDPSDVGYVAYRHGIAPPDVCRAFPHLDPEAWGKAIAEFSNARDKRIAEMQSARIKDVS